ncbi:MAG: MFS transporter [Candidatus Omnitrophica bacterium]|nr:MFS transporter [Candidatus Omnitrophota bacterium]
MNEKRQRTPEDRKRFAALMVIFFTVFIDLIGFGIIIPILQPYAIGKFGATEFQAGILMGVFSMVQFFFTPLWGWLSDRFGRKPILLITLLGIALSYVVLAVANSLTMLFVGRIMAGFFAGNIAIAQSYVADVTPPEKRAHGMGLIGAAFGLGFTFGPMIGGLLAHWGYAAPSFAAAGASGVAFLFGLIVLEESYPKEKRSEPSELRHPILNLAKVYSEHQVRNVVFANFLWTTTFSMWEVVLVLFVGFEVFPEIPEDDLPMRVGMIFGVMGLLSAFIQGGMIRQLMKHFDERKLTHIGIVFYIIGSLGFVGYLAGSFQGTFWPLVPALLLIAIGSAFMNTLPSAIVSRLVGPDRQGEVIGSFRGMGSLGRVVGPVVGAYFFAHLSHASPYIAGAVLMGVAFLLVMRRFDFFEAS